MCVFVLTFSTAQWLNHGRSDLAKANLAKAHGAKRVRIDLESEVDQA